MQRALEAVDKAAVCECRGGVVAQGARRRGDLQGLCRRRRTLFRSRLSPVQLRRRLRWMVLPPRCRPRKAAARKSPTVAAAGAAGEVTSACREGGAPG